MNYFAYSINENLEEDKLIILKYFVKVMLEFFSKLDNESHREKQHMIRTQFNHNETNVWEVLNRIYDDNKKTGNSEAVD